MSFRAVFTAVVLATALIVSAFLVNWFRPRGETEQPAPDLIRASGKCAECHLDLQYSVVHEYGLSAHARKDINCLQCHEPKPNQKGKDHHGFVITTTMTAANCRGCHEEEYKQFAQSRHAAPSWAAVYGEAGLRQAGLPQEQINAAEERHPGSCRRGPNALVGKEGQIATSAGCDHCHSVGRPNADGSIGTCTACHTRHTSSVAVARLPTTCGQCHMGPDHSQLEIYEESKHGVLFQAQRNLLKLDAPPQKLTTHEMFVPTCATCHMSGLNGMAVTHDPSDRLSWNLFAEVSNKRPNYERGQAEMKKVCANCHTQPTFDRVYADGEKTVASTNEKVKAAKDIVDGLRKDGLLKGPFEEPIDFLDFDLWHYYGRTSKHGAFMGGADFVQWHGNYPMLKHTVELKALAAEMRRAHGR